MRVALGITDRNEADDQVRAERDKERKDTRQAVRKTQASVERATLGDLGALSELKAQFQEQATAGAVEAKAKAEAKAAAKKEAAAKAEAKKVEEKAKAEAEEAKKEVKAAAEEEE